MAIVTQRSTALNNQTGGNPTRLEGGRHRSQAAVVPVTAGDSIGSVYKLARVLTQWRFLSLRMFTSGTPGGGIGLGLYQTDDNGGSVINQSIYTTSASLNSGTNTGLDLIFATRSPALYENQIWQDAGFTGDPRRALDLCMTLTAGITNTGFVAFDITYVAD
jgi:hypothetical protein